MSGCCNNGCNNSYNNEKMSDYLTLCCLKLPKRKRNDQESTPVQPVNNPVQEPYNPDVVTVEPAKNEDIFNAKFIIAVYRYKACDLDELSLYEGIWLTIFVSALLSSRVKVE